MMSTHAASEDRFYKIVRFFKSTRRSARTVKKNLTLQEAKAHCKNPNSSSETARGLYEQMTTAQNGPWFDGYEEHTEIKLMKTLSSKPPKPTFDIEVHTTAHTTEITARTSRALIWLQTNADAGSFQWKNGKLTIAVEAAFLLLKDAVDAGFVLG